MEAERHAQHSCAFQIEDVQLRLGSAAAPTMEGKKEKIVNCEAATLAGYGNFRRGIVKISFCDFFICS